MQIDVLPETFSVCRLKPTDRLPSWALELHEGFVSVTRTPDELSIVCREDAVPADGTATEDGWRALKVPGPIPFETTGVLASIANPLAAAEISIFAISTYDTDYVLVKGEQLEDALATLRAPKTRIASGSPFESVIGFSRAVITGDRVLVSGTGPVGAEEGSTLEQGRRCWEIVAQALAEAGAGVEDVVRTRTFLTPAADEDQAMQAHGEIFKAIRPASTMLRVHSLLNDSWTVEVEAEGVVSPSGRR